MAQQLVKRNFPPPVILTYPKGEHMRDRLLFSKFDLYDDVFELAKNYSLPIIEVESVNSQKVIDELLAMKVNAAFSSGCRDIIKPKFINAFERRIFNLHPTYLPDGRGATFSWKIMNGINEVAATVHFLDEGIDSGDIILQAKKPLSMEHPYPVDFIPQIYRLCETLIDQFLDIVEKGEIKSFPQKNDESTYFSRLYTEVNGAIDWEWPDQEIERFIRAFSYPYPGAFTFIGDRRIHILKARLVSDTPSHPYAVGKIKTVMDNGSIKVVLRKHTLIVEEVSFEGNICVPAQVCKISERFFTPYDILAKAKQEIYKAKDMKHAPLILKDFSIIEGDNLILEKFSDKFLTQEYLDWVKEPKMNIIHSHPTMTMEELRNYCYKLMNSKKDYLFAIVVKDNNKHIGNVRLGPIDVYARTCRFGFIIGDTAYHGRGIGTEIVRVCVDFCFSKLNIHKIHLGVWDYNKATIRVYEKNNFITEKVLPSYTYEGNCYSDLRMMELTNPNNKKKER